MPTGSHGSSAGSVSAAIGYTDVDGAVFHASETLTTRSRDVDSGLRGRDALTVSGLRSVSQSSRCLSAVRVA